MDRAERHEISPVREPVEDSGRDLQAETRFTGPTGTRERQQSRPLQQLACLAHLVVAADETRQLSGQVVRRRLQCLQRWKIGGKSLNRQLEKAFGASQVLEAMHAQVFQRQPGWQGMV